VIKPKVDLSSISNRNILVAIWAMYMVVNNNDIGSILEGIKRSSGDAEYILRVCSQSFPLYSPYSWPYA
jgi:hypothetical protein